jgi:hypothetical protein
MIGMGYEAEKQRPLLADLVDRIVNPPEDKQKHTKSSKRSLKRRSDSSKRSNLPRRY